MLHPSPFTPSPLSPASFGSCESSSSASPVSPGRLVSNLDIYPVLGAATAHNSWNYSQAHAGDSSTETSAVGSATSSPEESPSQTPQVTARIPVTNTAGHHITAPQTADQQSHNFQDDLKGQMQLPLHVFSSRPLNNNDHTLHQNNGNHLFPPPPRFYSHHVHNSVHAPAVLYPSASSSSSASSGPLLLLAANGAINSSISNGASLFHEQHVNALSSPSPAASNGSISSSTSSESLHADASPSDPPASSADSSIRKRRSISEDVLRERARKRLENHKRYDRKRAVILHGIHKDLKEVIHSSQQILQSSQKGIEEAAPKAEKEESENKSEDEKEGDDALMELPSRMELETLSHSELFSSAAKAIRSLQRLKSKLQAQVQAMPDDSAPDLLAFAQGTNNAANSLQLATSVQMQNISVLLSAVQSASRLYLDQVQKFQSLLMNAPHHAIADSALLPVHSVGGLTGRHFNSILRKKVLQDHLPASELTYLDLWGDADTDMYHNVNCPQLLQIYGMCALLSTSFCQQLAAYHQRFFPSADQVLDFLQQSVRTQLSSEYNSASLLSASPASDSQGHGSDHPLNQYSIPPQCFQIVGDVLNSLANLSESEYNRQVSLILPMLRCPFPLDRVRAPHFPRISRLDYRDRTTLEYMFSKYFTPTFAQMQALAELWSGKKAFVHFPGLTQPSPSDKILQGDFDFAFLLNPVTGEKVGLISFLKKLYFTESVKTVDPCLMPTHTPHTAHATLAAFAAAATSAAPMSTAFSSLYSSALLSAPTTTSVSASSAPRTISIADAAAAVTRSLPPYQMSNAFSSLAPSS